MRNPRYRRALEHDIDIVASLDDERYLVNGHRGINYVVDVDRFTCLCPDWRKHEPESGCKHLIAVELAQEGDDRISAAPEERTRRNRKREETEYPDNWEQLRQTVFRRDNWTCQGCGRDDDSRDKIELHAHHITPISDGGSHKLENLVTLCRGCHETLHGYAIGDGASGEGSTSTSKISDKRSPSANLECDSDKEWKNARLNLPLYDRFLWPLWSRSDPKRHERIDSETIEEERE